jgi:uncharacterized protein
MTAVDLQGALTMTTSPGEPASPDRDRDRDEQGRPRNARPRDRFGQPLPRGAQDEMADKEEPEDVVATVPEALTRAIELFDAQRFFEAHEFLEFIWKHEDVHPADKDFWKGVTQVAVACCHTQRGNDTGAVTLLERSARYLEPYPDHHHGVDAAMLARQALALARAVRTAGAHPDHDFEPFPTA